MNQVINVRPCKSHCDLSFLAGRKTPEGASVRDFDASFEQKIADVLLPYLSVIYRESLFLEMFLLVD